MAKSSVLATFIVLSFCFSYVLGVTQSNDDHFFVEGKVYCDPCRVEFETRLSYPLSGVKISLECRSPVNDSLIYSTEGFTDQNGMYSLEVKGDHQDEICQLKTVESTNSQCNEGMADYLAGKVVLTKNMGVSSLVRYVNSLGFKTPTIDPQCALVVKELGLDDSDI